MAYKQLGQAAPADTANATLYTPPDNTKASDITVFVCNTTGTTATFRLFHDDDGTTFVAGSALYFDKSVAANDSFEVPQKLQMKNSAGAIGVRSGTANALTFTAYGNEEEEQIG